MNELEYTRHQFERILAEARQDLSEFGDIGVGAYILDGLAVDYMLSKNEGDESNPPVPDGAVIELMRLSEFIEKMQYTLSILDDIWDLPAPEHGKRD